MKEGWIKAAAAVPAIRVADTAYNAVQAAGCIREAAEKEVRILVFPELCLTSATCGDLFGQRILLDGALEALRQVAQAACGTEMLVFLGMPLSWGGRLYDVAAVLYGGRLLGFVPRTCVDGTPFAKPLDGVAQVTVPGFDPVYFGADLLFAHKAVPELIVAAQIGVDRDMPSSPAARHTAAGATVVAQLDAFPATAYSARDMVNDTVTDSRRLHCGWISAAPGKGESTADKVYSGLCVVAEDGEILAVRETGDGLLVSEIDTDYLIAARRRSAGFHSDGAGHTTVSWGGELRKTEITRAYSKTPFLPADEKDLPDFCRRALDIQAEGLVKRMTHTGYYRPVIGASGGVDSTLVLLACASALDKLGLPRSNMVAVTMPCFGTTSRTKNNAIIIAEELGATLRIIPIGDSVREHFKAIGHDFDNQNVVFENAQARERTMVLFNIANEIGGLNVGTKDLSEQADGWCTFNGDQISNYDINAGMTKTMVRATVKYLADNSPNPTLREALLDILSTPVTPELLPLSSSGELIQKSEDSVGPYDLQDFFLHHLVRRAGRPEKVLRLAEYAYGDRYDRDTLIKWLRSYSVRLFSQQFKRSCTADGPDVTGFTFSPRAGHKMPSDASGGLWLDTIDAL
ncbi:MAG TPA: NAD(+) synthase [Clostridiales bacterium]|nr:NAD(+) synthase [Clostridiales bacterium]HBR08930.1 NAD(+) synthase [Clostridiales bacterium]